MYRFICLKWQNLAHNREEWKIKVCEAKYKATTGTVKFWDVGGLSELGTCTLPWIPWGEFKLFFWLVWMIVLLRGSGPLAVSF